MGVKFGGASQTALRSSAISSSSSSLDRLAVSGDARWTRRPTVLAGSGQIRGVCPNAAGFAATRVVYLPRGGSLFSAVVTTGIYCRPGCPARPAAENVARSRSPPRPRPPAFARACAAGPTARRSPRLDGSGARLPGGSADPRRRARPRSEAELGTRLGVSPRHLRRLFTAQLGVTPDGLARSARAHFARRLLDDTDLRHRGRLRGRLRQPAPVQSRVPRCLPASPRALRARRRKADRSSPTAASLRLPFYGRLDWDAMVALLRGPRDSRRRARRRRHVSAHDRRRRRAGVLELFPGGDDHLVLRAHLPHWEELVHVVQRARRIANLDFDLDGAGGPLARTRPSARCSEPPGLRPPGTWDPFETGVRAIIGQQVTIAGANTLAGRLVERLGTRVPGSSRSVSRTRSLRRPRSPRRSRRSRP